jgi:hypothetical protein
MDAALKRAMSLVGSNNDGGRPGDDFYPTPPGATRALLSVEKFDKYIWEPACGDGAISKVLIEAGHGVCSTDLYDHGYGKSGFDFLLQYSHYEDQVITNPPFKLADQFVTKCVTLGIEKFALLCKLQFLEGQKRSKILQSSGLARVWIFSKRLSLTRNGLPMKNGGMIAFAWYIFEKGYTGKPEIGWIESID